MLRFLNRWPPLLGESIEVNAEFMRLMLNAWARKPPPSRRRS
jgi:hypothetical protein